MAHEVTAPALQRLRRLLNQRVRPAIVSAVQKMEVAASPELFETLPIEMVASLGQRPFAIGDSWGRPWHTTWFAMRARVTDDIATLLAAGDRHELVAHIDLGFTGRGDGFQVEGMVWHNGQRVQAVQPDRRLIPIELSADDGGSLASSSVEIWVEAMATPIIAGHESGYGPTHLGDPATAGDTPLYLLRRAELGVLNRDVSDLAVMLHALMDLIIDLDERDPQRARLFAMVEDVERVLDIADVPRSAHRAVRFLEQSLRDLPGNKAGNDPHRIVAAGHAHLDTAWLWPLRETRRKAVRTFVNAVGLLKRNPDVVFSHSQAQHYAWVEEDAPEVFEAVRTLVAEGQWEPVGGMWVETDLNLPSGESLLRQFVHGQRAFARWFGQRSTVAFLPDDFGYPGSLPQIVHHAGSRWFFTQKMSWSETNTFPHHTFWWEGIDGSRLFTHFSPADTYNALLTPSQMRYAARNFRDHRGASHSLVLFGHGDGGGGPTQEMVDRGRLTSLLPATPTVDFGSVTSFFQSAQEEYASGAPVWVGEMYLEKHRGTFSSQIRTKQGNRRCEQLLHELELWSAVIGEEQPVLGVLWQRVLTQQFHDIIPGSSIAWVHQDAQDEHLEVAETIEERLTSLLSPSQSERRTATGDPVIFEVLNPAPVGRREVVTDGDRVAWAEIPPFGSIATVFSAASPLPDDVFPVEYQRSTDGSITLSNGKVSCTIDSQGGVSRLESHDTGRNVIGAVFEGLTDRESDINSAVGHLVIGRDTPAEYDAWDIDRADADAPGIPLLSLSAPVVDIAHPSHVRVSAVFRHGASSFVLRWTLRADSARVDLQLEADWHGSNERLQWMMPVNVLARDAVCGIQFGHVRRARHQNTTWDAARFEVCAHRYVHVHEPGCGVALLADGPRGYDIRDHHLALTLLRAPQFPDPLCDIGPQVIEWSIWLGDGSGDIADVEAEAARVAHPLRIHRTDPEPHGSVNQGSLRRVAPISVDARGVMVSAIKMADDSSGDLIVRLWECRGARASGDVYLAGRLRDSTVQVMRCNALEEPKTDVSLTAQPGDLPSGDLDDSVIINSGPMKLQMAPFEIRTYRLHEV